MGGAPRCVPRHSVCGARAHAARLRATALMTSAACARASRTSRSRAMLRSLVTRACAVLLAAAIPAVASPARAQPGTATSPRRVVTVAIRGPRRRGDDALGDHPRALRAPRPDDGRRGRGPAARRARGRPDRSGRRRRAGIVVKGVGGSTILDRQVHDPNAAIQREQIAHAVRGAAEAEILAEQDRVAGRPPATAPSATATISPPPPALEGAPPPRPRTTSPRSRSPRMRRRSGPSRSPRRRRSSRKAEARSRSISRRSSALAWSRARPDR